MAPHPNDPFFTATDHILVAFGVHNDPDSPLVSLASVPEFESGTIELLYESIASPCAEKFAFIVKSQSINSICLFSL